MPRTWGRHPKAQQDRASTGGTGEELKADTCNPAIIGVIKSGSKVRAQ